MGKVRGWTLGEFVGLGGLMAYIWYAHGRCLPELLSFHPWASVATVLEYTTFATVFIELNAALFSRAVEAMERTRTKPAHRPVYRQMGESRRALGAAHWV